MAGRDPNDISKSEGKDRETMPPSWTAENEKVLSEALNLSEQLKKEGVAEGTPEWKERVRQRALHLKTREVSPNDQADQHGKDRS